MNARSYTEALAQNLQTQEQSWREKAEGLQQEVLRLRQEVVLAQVGTVPNSNSSTEQGPDDAEERFSQDLFAPSDPPPDSDSLTPDLLLPDSQPLAPSYRPSQVPLDSSLYGHVNFLQTLCSLQRVKGDSRGLEVLWLSPGGGSGHGASSVLVESVCQLLEAVVGVCTHPGPHSPTPHVVEACDTAVRTMDLLCFLKLPSVEVRKQVEKTLTELTQALLMLQGDQPRQTSEQLVQCLLTLGQSNMSRSFLIGHLLSQISTEANQLWTISQQDLDQRQHQNQNPSPALFRLDQYQNSCQLFWIVEQLLGSSSIRVEVDLEQTGFGRHLDRQVFLMSDEFPLFSIYMWRIGGLLRSSHTEKGSNVL
ncbi:meiosis-specific protein MEI4 isoform X2 [Cynoglossus semilaevis]|nr:meiosis-specific protein MEI4 isoform X2 [Cynoglossus semilaevis]